MVTLICYAIINEVDDYGYQGYKDRIPKQAHIIVHTFDFHPFYFIMQSITYLCLTALLCSSVNGCLSEHQARHQPNASHIETQLKLIRTRTQDRPPTGKTALTNVRVFDGWSIGGPSTVVIEGDSISFDFHGVQNTIDGEGGVLLPGLIDSHLHLSSMASLETLSSYGVTTAMNMGCVNYTLCSALRDQIGLTSCFSGGESAAAPNSTHATVFGAQGLVYSSSQAPEFVVNVFGNGSDYMKIISEPNGFNQATHDALVSATHALGKVSMTHAQDYDSYEVAIRSRTDGIQHVPFDIPLTEEMAQRIKQQGQYVTPTLNIGKIVAGNLTAESILSSGNLTYEAGVTSLQRLMRAGVPILAGTDATDATETFLEGDQIGITLHRELQYLTEAGMSELDVLRAATVVPSIWHNLTRRGSIREGYRADLLLLKPGSDPLQNISKTMDIARVWNGGIEYLPMARMK
jgi:imidazolonepropionase-like amidohydrolase